MKCFYVTKPKSNLAPYGDRCGIIVYIAKDAPQVEDASAHGTPDLQRPLTKAVGLYGLAPDVMEYGDAIVLARL